MLTAKLTLLAGCSVGPDYLRPTADAPGGYKEVVGWKMAQPKDDVIKGEWWKIYEDPQLDALEEQIQISNQNVLAAEAQFRQARALVQAARAAYFPTITVGLGITRARQSTTRIGGSGNGMPFSDYTLPIDVTWELDVWGRIRRSVESSEASAQASAADLESARLSAQADLAQDYFLLRTLDAQKQLLETSVANFQKSLDLTNNRYAAGIASRGDVLQAETQLKSTQAQAIDVGVQRAQTEHAIAVLIGKPPSGFSIPTSPLSMTTVPPPTPLGVPSELLERRSDIAAAERRVAASNAQVGVAVAAYFPTVSIVTTNGFESSFTNEWLSAPSRFWAVGPVISETVFDGGFRLAQTAAARAAYDATVAQYRETVLTAFQQVEDNLAALRILEQETQTQDEAVKAAQQTVVILTNQYKAGTVSYLSVVVFQTAELNNEQAAVNLLGRRLSASVLLIKALGGGWNASSLSP